MRCFFRCHRWARILLPVLVLFVVSSTHADGVYIPPDAVEILPEMPNQRGLIIWRDGVEQLLVESDFDGAGEQVAWIVPVPAEPTDISVGAPGVFDVLQKGLVPKTVRSGPGLFVAALLLLSLCACQWAIGVYALKRTITYTVVCAGLLFFLFMTTPSMFMTLGDSMGEGPGLSEGAEVLAVRSVGSYEVTTLHATEVGGLNQWLSENNFRALPQAGAPIVSAYIAEGWCFVVAKLQRSSGGYTRPHPLSITFPAEQPVYPMRLTGLADTELFLNLYVISDRRAKVPGMETVYCERFRKDVDGGVEKVWGTQYSEANSDSFWLPKVEAGDSMGLYSNKTKMALPWLVEHMRDEDVLTHLRAQVPVDAMDKDIAIDFRRFARTRPRLMLPEDRKVASAGYGLCALGLVLSVGLMTHYEQIQKKRKPFRKSLALLISLVVAAVASQIPAWTTKLGQSESYDRYERRSVPLEKAFEMLQKNPAILEGMDKAAMEAYLLECLTYPKAGKVSAGDFLGEGPGRFEIIEDERGILLRTYGEDNDFFSPSLGVPLEYPILTSEGKAFHGVSRLVWMPEEAYLHVFPRDGLSFDYVAPGERKALPVTLSNRGGPVVTGHIAATPPYYVQENQIEYALKPGTSIQVEIEYRPVEEGLHEGSIEFEGNNRGRLEVYGIAYSGQPATEAIRIDDYWGARGRGGGVTNSTAYRTYRVALRNDNTFPVDLQGWGISNDPLVPFKHVFPENTIIAPEDYIIVYLLTEPLQPGQGYSVGFELQPATDGYLGLTNPLGALVSEKNYALTRKDDPTGGLFPGRR